ENSELVPDLALRWETPDPTTYIFHLRDDARFHDGRPLTSKDIQYTFRTMTDGTVRTIKAGHPYNLITGMETPDPYTIVFNFTDPLFRDVRVRQAFAYGIDRDSIIKYLWRNQARPASGLLPPTNWAYKDDVHKYPYDPERARQLLRDAGQEHLKFTYHLNN